MELTTKGVLGVPPFFPSLCLFQPFLESSFLFFGRIALGWSPLVDRCMLVVTVMSLLYYSEGEHTFEGLKRIRRKAQYILDLSPCADLGSVRKWVWGVRWTTFLIHGPF